MSQPIHPLSIFRREFLTRTVDTLTPHFALSVSPDATQFEAVELMCKERTGSVLVIESNKEVVGIVTERDVLNKWSNGKVDRQSPVTELMSANPQVIKHNASIARVVHLMAVGGYRHVPVLYGGAERPRIISSKDFVDVIHKRLTSKILNPDTAIALDDNLVDQFFGSNVEVLKPDPALILNESKKVSEALALLREKKKGAVVMTDHHHNISGIFTERDYVRKVAVIDQDPAVMRLSDRMTPQPQTLPVTASIAMGFSLLSEGGYRHIPLVDSKEKLVGMLSVRNFLSYLSTSIVKSLEAGK